VCCIACEFVKFVRVCENLCSNVHALLFIGSRGARTLSGVPTYGSGDILNNVHIGALNASDPEIFLISLRLDMVLCRLAGIGSAAADMRRGSRAVAVESALADRRRGYTDLPCCSLCAV
jgi:hypothetical protein